MAEIFAYRHDEWESSLRKIGFFLGKFIYLMDAYDDVEKDIKSGSYNPFRKAYLDDPAFADDCRSLLTLMMSECSRNSNSFRYCCMQRSCGTFSIPEYGADTLP